ncbi:GGDEF domain-containing protein [Hwanghaeella grinnelliae]|uniref:GGDEF domain-containing protein n=1 Tax=Hwanghaeella grinnelliae TaxID=2500179 RepID=A0A3S2Y405_9PROT|nr:GGDEF domain-containing protein [Hwanghaeella grinnelliae]RVU37926.1 GGDEF domain-containing protein [Hwanghaeella grinnelliae]
MSDEDFWDIDQYLTTRRNREIGTDRVVDPVRSTPEVRAYDASADRVEPVGRDLPDRRKRQRKQPRDIAEIHGLDEAEIDGNVRHALADLIQEIGLLHDDLRLAEGRIQFLEGELGQDDLGDWLDRKGFLGQLSRLSTLDEKEGGQSSLVLVRLDGFTETRRKLGWATADELVEELGRRLTQIPNSVIGHVADDMFGVLLVGVPGKDVGTALGEAIPAEIRVHGTNPDLAVVWVAVDMRPGQSELSQLSAAERKLPQQSGGIRQ